MISVMINRLRDQILFLGLTLFCSFYPLTAQIPAIISDIRVDGISAAEVNLSGVRKVFRNSPWNPTNQKALQQQIHGNLKLNGYYFSSIDSLSTIVTKAAFGKRPAAILVTLFVSPGRQLWLDSLAINGIDSLPELLQNSIRDRAGDEVPGIYHQALLDYLLGLVIGQLEDNGYPLARAKTGKFFISEVEKRADLFLEIAVQPGDSVKLDYLRFPRSKSHLSSYLQRLLRFKPGDLYRENRISRYRAILQRQEFMRSVSPPVLSRDGKGQYFLDIAFEEAPATALDGIIGYVPPASTDITEDGYFTGQLNIGIRNLFGGGRKLQIFWQKQDRFSDEFRLAYREPFIFSLPFHTEFGMNRLVRDTTFIEWRYRVRVDFPLNENLTAFVDVANRTVFPDSLASRQLRLPQTASLETETGLEWEATDSRANPRRGLNLALAFNLANQKNEGPEYLIIEDSLRKSVTLRRMRGDLSIYLPALPRQVLANEVHVEFIDNNAEALRITDQVYFGGATTVRGFREAQFFAKRVFWVKSEYRFLLGPQSRFFLFSDNSWYTRDVPEPKQEWLTSFGLGLRFPIPLGILQFDYGLEKGASFQEGKLHFRLVNEF